MRRRMAWSPRMPLPLPATGRAKSGRLRPASGPGSRSPMSTFHLHRGWREPDGLITAHGTLGRVIEAASASDAVSTALAEGDFLIADGANLAWLIDDQGALVWSLRLGDE